MRAILGIDAAWTLANPSGVALIVDQGYGWKLRCVSSSYSEFTSLGPPVHCLPGYPLGSAPDAKLLLKAAADLAGCEVDLVAIDMPLSRQPIMSRRTSDNMVSVAWGARHCSTHTPSADRPGKISDELREAFESLGYPLRTIGPHASGLYEVYPHPALVELTRASKRLPYKESKQRVYWPELTTSERRMQLLSVWRAIVADLDTVIEGTAAQLPIPTSLAKRYEMKAFEDRLDAIVCAWVGACVMDGTATAYGDEASAIWIPNAR